jgi:DNA-binding winged helix-turn-helix (wHTH) protein
LKGTVSCSHFSFDPKGRTLVASDGARLHLTPKAFDLLQILIEEAPRVVRKAELHTRLWPDSFVSDAALTSLVKELRRVLRDLAGGAPLIKTTHGVGYAFDHACVPARPVREDSHFLVGARRRYVLNPGANVLGRDAMAEVSLDGFEVSRRHACIVVTGEKATVEDLGSKNGTAVDGTLLLSRLELKDGDRIRVGSVTLVYRRQTGEESTATMAGH